MARMAKGGAKIIYGYTLPARGKTNDRTYFNMVYRLNEEQIVKDAEKFQRGIQEKYKLNAKDWLKRQVAFTQEKNNIKGLKATFETLIEEKLAVDISSFIERTLSGLNGYFPNQMKAFYEVIKAEGDQFDPKRLKYIGQGEGTYEYITNNFTPIVIDMTNSPFDIAIYVKGERIA